MGSWRGRNVTRLTGNRVTKRKTEDKRRGREIERWGRVYSFPLICCPFILRGSDQRCVSRSGLHILDRSLPGVPQTAPLCLGKLERELIVFKVPWEESDAHSHWVLSRHRQLGAQPQHMPAVLHFCSRSPRCKTGDERRCNRSMAWWCMRQWSTTQWQYTAQCTLVSPEEMHWRSWNFISCVSVKPPSSHG